MKIQFILSNGVKKINVQYNNIILKKHKNKLFNADDYLGALNFALGLPDLYLMSIPLEILNWAKNNGHRILHTKNLSFI